jgi:hypothetical protein
MKTVETVYKNTHGKEVASIINSVKDKEVQNEMIEASNHYAKAIHGLRLAKQSLEIIDEDNGLDHSEIINLVLEVISATQHSEISLLDMVANSI